VSGHNAAMQALAESTQVRRCFASQWYGYALGSLRGVRAYAADLDDGASADWVDYLVARASTNQDFDLTELFLAAVESEEFLAP